MTPTPSATSLPCPACGVRFARTPEYLAAYGGRTTACTGCGHRIELPTLDSLGGPPAYAAQPSPEPASSGIWRSEQGLAVVSYTAKLPPCCIKCNAPAVGPRVPVHLKWSADVETGSDVASGVARWMNQKQITVRVYLCPRHRARAARARLGGATLIAAGAAIFFIPLVLGFNATWVWSGVAAGAVVACAGAVWRIAAGRLLAVEFMDERHAWVGGFGPEFLDGLPSFEAAEAARVAETAANLYHIHE